MMKTTPLKCLNVLEDHQKAAFQKLSLLCEIEKLIEYGVFEPISAKTTKPKVRFLKKQQKNPYQAFQTSESSKASLSALRERKSSLICRISDINTMIRRILNDEEYALIHGKLCFLADKIHRLKRSISYMDRECQDSYEKELDAYCAEQLKLQDKVHSLGLKYSKLIYRELHIGVDPLFNFNTADYED